MNCPRCNTENIKYFKKRQTVPGEDSGEILCVCQECGHKWKRVTKKAAAPVAPSYSADAVSRPRQQSQNVPVQRRRQAPPQRAPKKPEWTKQERVLQNILAVLLWPVTISYWFYENRAIKMKKNIRIGVICVTWLLVIAGIIGLVYTGTRPKPEVKLDYSVSTTVNVSTAKFATTTKPEKSNKKAEKTTDKSTSAAETTTTNAVFS